MFTLVRRFVKTAIAFLLIGLAIGAWLLWQRELSGRAPGAYVISAHTHAIVVGFVMMLIMGVALWLFPRPDQSDTRYSPALAEASYWLITIGTAGRIVGELARPSIEGAWLRWTVVICGAFQIAGVATFFWTMWSRIRAVGSRQREARGERF